MLRIVSIITVWASLCPLAASPVSAADHDHEYMVPDMVPAGEPAKDADSRYEQIELQDGSRYLPA